jgi:broad specificity phosphatase PhoE
VKLYLVRHAGVTVCAALPSAQWHLSPEGRAAADALADEPFWPGVRGIHTSPEPKACATAQRIAARHGLPIRIEPELREVERPWMGEHYADAVRRYLAREAIDGWEGRSEALARVRGCIERIVERHQGLEAGVVSHGLALTLYLSDLLGLEGAASHALWSGMGFPDVAVGPGGAANGAQFRKALALTWRRTFVVT